MKRRKIRRALPVLSSQEIVECSRLSARLSLGACVRRYVLAQSGDTRTPSDWNRNGRSMENETLVSCRNCSSGRQRTHNQEVSR